jgi:hypothetical protein
MTHRNLLPLLLLLLLTPGTAHAARAVTVPKPEIEQASSTVTIAPHRAIYTMTLKGVKNGGSITGTSGRMLFEWGDSCDGWPVQQHLQMHFTYAEGDEGDVNSSVISWESKDGTKYNFNVRRTTNGKEKENFRGRATLSESGGAAKYAIPKDKKDIALSEGTIFPSTHTIMILDKAMAGEKLFTRRVFDGSDEDGMADVSTFIGPKIEALPPEIKPDVRANPLLAAPAWPVRLAFFKPDTETGEPDYEMDLTLQANGIVRSMLIDYGDFSVLGTLSSLEDLKAASCKP